MSRRHLPAVVLASLMGAVGLCQCGLRVSTSPPATPTRPARLLMLDAGNGPQTTPPSGQSAIATPSRSPSLRTNVAQLVLPTEVASPTPTPVPAPPERLTISDLGLDVEVVPVAWIATEVDGTTVSQWQDPPVGTAGWHVNSGRPGSGTNIVISGHHNIAGQVFRDLILLEPGQTVSLWAQGRRYDYVVAEKLILPERGVPQEQRLQNASWMQPTLNERLTLITCWPQSSNTHRLVIWARPNPGAPEASLAER